MNWYNRAALLTVAFFVSRLISLFPDVMSVITFAGALLVVIFEWLAQMEKKS